MKQIPKKGTSGKEVNIPIVYHGNRQRYGSVMMTPDWTIVERIRKIDPNLYVTWNRNKERWVIVEKGRLTGKDHVVTRLEEEDGSYRPLDNRILKDLKRMRWELEHFDLATKMEQDEKEERERSDREFQEEIRSIGDYYAYQLMGIPHYQVPKSYQRAGAPEVKVA